MNTIKKLPQEVINRIAAGEVIQRPLSAIKEMIENSIDANSSMISIFCVDGGFSSIEINDDGNGVPAKDFPLLCERFATSKITDFTDLMKINSFGFRGEALASISFVSHLTIKSKTIQDNLGFQASFRDGIMLEDTIESISMNKGTIINVEKLFYNLGIRKESFTHKEEFKEILKLVHKLSIHHYNIKFKLYSSINNIEFSSCNLLSKGKNARIELISNIYKFNEKSLISTEESISKYSVKIESVISEVGSVKKNRDVIIFINDRFIECDQIKKTVDSIYKSFWVSIHEDEGGYFCYISLSMRTENIDVNVDPRKKFVKFLFANEICDEIKQIFEQKLKEKCSIKVFQTVSLPKNFLDTNKKKIDQNNNDIKIQNHRPSDKFLIRVDPKTQKLTSFLNSNLQNSQRTNEEKFDNQILMNLYNNKIKKTQEDEDNVIFQILSLKKETSDEQTTKFFHNLTYVGCINSNFILVQKDQSLLIINTIPICLEIFTHISLISIQKYEEFLIPEKINIRKSFENILSQQELNENVKNQIIQKAFQNLQKEADFLRKYFCLIFEEEFLLTFPKLHHLIIPKNKEIEHFLFILLNQIINIDIYFEKIERICEEIAKAYSWSLENNNFFDDFQKIYDEIFSLTLFPFMKKCCFFKKNNYDEYSYNLLNLEDAYKIFERC